MRQFLARRPVRSDLLTTLRRLGLSTGLKVCLDAGDAASYTSGQSWLDRSGNGQDFFLGADGSATATDPTFAGSAGRLSASEYWSVDGGDYFTYDSANESWMNDMHKAAAKFSFAAAIYGPPVNSAIFGTNGGLTVNTGCHLYSAGTGNYVFNAVNAGVLAYNWDTGLVATAGWQVVAISIDDAASSGVATLNGGGSTKSGAYSSPAAGASTYTLQVAARGNGSLPLGSGGRIGWAAFWSGYALSGREMRALFDATRARFGI